MLQFSYLCHHLANCFQCQKQANIFRTPPALMHHHHADCVFMFSPAGGFVRHLHNFAPKIFTPTLLPPPPTPLLLPSLNGTVVGCLSEILKKSYQKVLMKRRPSNPFIIPSECPEGRGAHLFSAILSNLCPRPANWFNAKKKTKTFSDRPHDKSTTSIVCGCLCSLQQE